MRLFVCLLSVLLLASPLAAGEWKAGTEYVVNAVFCDTRDQAVVSAKYKNEEADGCKFLETVIVFYDGPVGILTSTAINYQIHRVWVVGYVTFTPAGDIRRVLFETPTEQFTLSPLRGTMS